MFIDTNPLSLQIAVLVLSTCVCWAACSDDEGSSAATDVASGTDAGLDQDGGLSDAAGSDTLAQDASPESGEDEPDAGGLADAPIDLPGDTGLDLQIEVSPDVTTLYPDPPESACVDGGDGARGTILFENGAPLVEATVALITPNVKYLGFTDESGGFFIRAPCEPLAVEVASFESESYPTHPSLTNLPLPGFDAGAEEPTWIIPLVPVDGVINDVLGEPIPAARLEALLQDGPVRVYNEQEADESGQFRVNLVPWAQAPYQLTARGPQDSEKRYRSATLTVIIVDSPPEPVEFVLFEDRCSVIGTIHTSEGTGLEWLYLRVEGDPYASPIIYYSFERGFYYDRTMPDVIYEELPLFCGVQTLRLWNAIWLNPDWPCRDPRNTNQLCLSNFPLWVDRDLEEPLGEGVEIQVVRIEGTVYDQAGDPQEDVMIHIEGAYQWGDSGSDTLFAFNEAVTDESGHYSMVVLPYDDVEWTVTARIRDTDSRPLGELETTVVVPGPTTFDIEMPEAEERCALSGTIHSSEGRDFNEIQARFRGYDTETLEYLYLDSPFAYFSPEPGFYYKSGFPDDEIPFVPLFCGDHDLELHSVDWPGCNLSADEICFSFFPWWGSAGYDAARQRLCPADSTDPNCDQVAPLDDGLEIPVAHLSGFITDSSGTPVSGVSVNAMYAVGFFNFATNGTGTGLDGLYDFVVLPDRTWTVSVGISDDHPRLDDLWPPEAVDVAVDETGGVANIVIPDGPERCRFSGTVYTSNGVDLERLSFTHFGPWYGLFGWYFHSDEPGVYYRDGNNALLLDWIPLVCGENTMYIDSRKNAFRPSCVNPERFDQPCLEGWLHWSGYDLTTPVSGVEIPVVELNGRVTRDGLTPIQGANIEAFATVYEEGLQPGDPPRRVGGIRNFAVTRPDGTYRMAVVPSALEESEYTITITTPLDVDLGEITHNEVIGEDTTVDADFSLTE